MSSSGKWGLILHLSCRISHRCSVDVDSFSPSSTQYHRPRLAAYKPKLAYRHDFCCKLWVVFILILFFNFKTLQLNIFLKLQFGLTGKTGMATVGPHFACHMIVRADCLGQGNAYPAHQLPNPAIHSLELNAWHYRHLNLPNLLAIIWGSA